MNKREVEVHDQNLPTGFLARAATLDDLVATVAMLNDAYKATIGAEPYTIEFMRREWTEPGFNLESDSRLVLSVDGQVVGYYEVWDAAEPAVRVMIRGQVHPAYCSRGIGTYLLRWAERRASRAMGKAPEGARVVVHAYVMSVNADAGVLFKNEGFALIRHSWRMVIHLDATPVKPQWPDGISVRTLRAGLEEVDVLRAALEAFKDHWGFVEVPFEQELERWMHRLQHDSGFDPSLWFLALDGEQIAGVSLCRLKAFDDPEMGWIDTLAVRRPWRRRGLALALLQHSFQELRCRGKTTVGLGVDAQNLTGATRLYERAGMHPDPSHEYDLFEKELRPGYEVSTQTIEV